MKSNVLLLLSSLVAVSAKTIRGGDVTAPTRHSQGRIIGGTTAQEDRYSFSVSLQDKIGHFCGGTLISPDVVISAAHCAGGSYDVVVGRHDQDDRDGEEIGVAKELSHPDYDEDTTDNDYMLLFLERPVKGDVKFASVTDDFVGVSEAVTVVGWGDVMIDDDVSIGADELQEVELYTISNQDCDDSEGRINGSKDDYHDQITSSMLCAEHPKQKDACQGDSGGPLIKKSGSGDNEDFELVGVVSWGVGCAQDDFPGVYARVSAEYDWIKKEVCRRSSDPPANFACGSGANPRPPSPSPPNPRPPTPSPPSPNTPPSGGLRCDDYNRKGECKDAGCSWDKGSKTCSGGLFLFDSSGSGGTSGGGGCSEYDGKKTKCKKEGCKWNGSTDACKSKSGGGGLGSSGGSSNSSSSGSCSGILRKKKCKQASDCEWRNNQCRSSGSSYGGGSSASSNYDDNLFGGTNDDYLW